MQTVRDAFYDVARQLRLTTIFGNPVLVGVLAAESIAGVPSYRDTLPGAFASGSGCGRKTTQS